MEKKMCSYETLFIINGTLAEDAIRAIADKFIALATEQAAELKVDEWGKRRLAYPINYINEGYYVLLSYKSEPTFPREIQRVLGITDGIMRSMTTVRNEGAQIPVPAAAETAAPAATESEATTEE